MMSDNAVNSEKNYHSFGKLALAIIIVASIIMIFVLFKNPMPGVADQGDFQRVMDVTGLDEKERNTEEFNSHWYRYVTPEYKVVSLDIKRLVGIIPTTSMIYPITVARILSRILGKEYFSTRLLAVVYALFYLLSLYMCIKYVNLRRRITVIFFGVLSLIILLDGNYLIWFNSLYGEPMMITGLLFFVGSVLYVLEDIDLLGWEKVLLLCIAALLFLGAKMQCFVAFPFIVLMIVRIISYQNKITFDVNLRRVFTISAFILIFYVGGIYMQINGTCGVDTEYNSVFYGILKDSATPEKDLAVLGLSPDMSVEAGKHAYLPKDQYVKYVPWSEVTKTEFNEKVSNLKLLRFYLSQPKRFIEVMKFTAAQSFDTRGYLGKYERAAVSEYTYTFERFTFWSDIRNSVLPKKLTFLIIFYVSVFIVSLYKYINTKSDKVSCMKIELFWMVIIIGVIQFPMPYLGNGAADTAKQLFLFNYTFDITFLVAATWLFDYISLLCKNICCLVFYHHF
jgi:hypothetical protein